MAPMKRTDQERIAELERDLEVARTERNVALERVEEMRAAAALAKEVAARDARRMPPIVIDGMGAAVAAKELADAMEESRAQLLDALREILDADVEVENFATPRWNAALDRARALLRGH